MKRKFSRITDLPVLTVFAVFAVCVLTVLLCGAQVYQTLVDRNAESFGVRTAAQYLSTRVRQAEDVAVTDFEGCEALTMHERIDGMTCVTRVYCYDGYIRELYGTEVAVLPPQSGEKIMPAEELRFSAEGDLLTVQVDGHVIYLQLRGKGAASP